jgi:choline kinase
MKVIILVAGISSRLRPLTENTPKCLLKIGKKLILERMLDNLIANGLNDFVFVTGYLENQIKKKIITNYPNINVEFIYNDVYNTTNNIYSLWMTKEAVKGEAVLLLDGDIIFDEKIVTLLLGSNYKNCLALRSEGGIADEEIKVTLAKDKSIKEISKTIDPKLAIGESIGIEKFSSEYMDALFAKLDTMIIEEDKVNLFYEAAFEETINEGEKIFTIDVGSLKCMELDTVEDAELAKKEVLFFDKEFL